MNNINTSDLYQLFLDSPRIVTDSRASCEGAIFLALKGQNFDGNRFAAQAIANGATCAVIDNPDLHIDGQTIVVDDALRTLQELARLHRATLGLPVIGITGTNGKTTTKELLAAVLSTRYKTLYTSGNFNNHIGLPLTLLALKPEHEIAVVEMGASKPGDIAELAEIALPNYGIITNLGHAHLEGFGSFDNLVAAKGELYDFIRRTGGTIFRKSSDDILLHLAAGMNEITYGADAQAHVSAHATANNPYLAFRWKYQGETHTVETRLVGNYNIDNATAAIAVGCHFNIPPDDICRAIEAYLPTNNRSQLRRTASNTVIIDAYNANPDSMKAAIRNFMEISATPKAVILGDMKELGKDSLALHESIVQEIAQGNFDRILLCGEHFSQVPTPDTFTTFRTTGELTDHLRAQPLTGFCILLKASRSMAFERIADIL
ncbi:MAG: UDP-N-acetylmuramoyl-tripeptide--D-alanyl-D-alanine ligase [Tannerellaceae bacterium]|jgi:UDP-N-acetylmuramoyl-tripeptide--D-alanyl-D-alanine ligase|nr:UDP-N-acetylmuramoyl-tripeptide--D-alanyl-D-alanine ligase [Tannerellaceae bacterium]